MLKYHKLPRTNSYHHEGCWTQKSWTSGNAWKCYECYCGIVFPGLTTSRKCITGHGTYHSKYESSKWSINDWQDLRHNILPDVQQTNLKRIQSSQNLNLHELLSITFKLALCIIAKQSFRQFSYVYTLKLLCYIKLASKQRNTVQQNPIHSKFIQ